MVSKTVEYTAQNGLCCGCGVCKGICPKGCISWERKDGLYLPKVEDRLCINCGLCTCVCPGLGHVYAPEKDTARETVTGAVLSCCNAWSKDADLRHVSASGGVTSAMIRTLLGKGVYDGAFCLDSYDYHEQLKTQLCTAEDVFRTESNAPKSRYLPVSHENAVMYMKSNRNKKLIFVGTSCAIRALQAAVEKLSLNREQYLFIGLFCDRVFNYNVQSYFEDTYAHGKKLKSLHFKNKESGGWPGDMKFFPEHGEAFYVPLAERAKAKDYFMPERCLYCVDKLNACADISLGDNYTGKDDSPLGSNSVIIRTPKGLDVWNQVKAELEERPIDIADIQNAQFLIGRLNHLYFGALKEKRLRQGMNLNSGVQRTENCREYERAWFHALKKLQCGAGYHCDPQGLRHQMHKDAQGDITLVRFIKRVYYYLRRKLLR